MEYLGTTMNSLPKVLENFGFGALLTAFVTSLLIAGRPDLWDLLSNTVFDEKWSGLFGLHLFALFTIYLIGVLVKNLGEAIWSVSHRFSEPLRDTKVLKDAIGVENDRVWLTYENYASKVDFYFGLLGLSTIVFLLGLVEKLILPPTRVDFSLVFFFGCIALVALVQIRLTFAKIDIVLATTESST